MSEDPVYLRQQLNEYKRLYGRAMLERDTAEERVAKLESTLATAMDQIMHADDLLRQLTERK